MTVEINYGRKGLFTLDNVYGIESDGVKLSVRHYGLGDCLVVFQMARVREIRRVD